MHMYRLVATASTALLLAACAVGPRYTAPASPPSVITNASAAAFERRDPEAAWWREFADPTLDSLVGRALAGNLDLRIAVDRVRAARAVFVERNFDYAPHVTAGGGYTHSREQVPGFGPARADIESASLGFDAAWELDLFGHVRRSVEAARADLGAEQAGYRDAEVTVAAEVARNYFELRGTQKRLAVARANASREQQSLELTQLREQAGRGAELDVARSRARLKATAATIPPLEAAEQQAGYRLAVLLGSARGASMPSSCRWSCRPTPRRCRSAIRRAPAPPPGRPRRGTRARRGDGARRHRDADLFPRVSVTGFVGFLSGDVRRLFGTTPGLDTRAWSVSRA